MDGEKCVRCGEVGEDRRTLHMACFYAMEELGLPFEEEVLFSADIEALEKAKEPFSIDVDGKKINVTPGTVTCKGELAPHHQYTLRVCKKCRSEWMKAIKQWFYNVEPEESCGSGIFVRENGHTKEITREEWNRRQHFED